MADGSPYIGVSVFFPSYDPAQAAPSRLEDRINGCFLRSMNGKPLPLDRMKLKAMVARFLTGCAARPSLRTRLRPAWTDQPKHHSHAENGKKIYQAQCGGCAMALMAKASRMPRAKRAYPPLRATSRSTFGAGMARTYTAARLSSGNMPIWDSQQVPLGQGWLMDQEAVDVAEYFSY